MSDRAGAAKLAEAAAAAELVLLTVPDDAIAPLAAQLRWRPGQTVLVRFGPGDKGLMAAEIHPDNPGPAIMAH